MSEAARILADAIRGDGRRRAKRENRSRARATVTSVDPLELDLHGSDLVLDDDDVEFSQDVARYSASEGLDEGDVLVLIEVDEGDWVAVTVVSDKDVRAVPDGS